MLEYKVVEQVHYDHPISESGLQDEVFCRFIQANRLLNRIRLF